MNIGCMVFKKKIQLPLHNILSLPSLFFFLPSSRTLFTLLTAFSPYSSARCLAFFTDLPRNFFNWVLVRNTNKPLIYFKLDDVVKEGNTLSFSKRQPKTTSPYVLCFSFPPSVSVIGVWVFSSSSDCAASFLQSQKYISVVSKLYQVLVLDDKA